tara:strand:- start:784 stop:1005 length:222 start_codon:yes stop_codon:yes gene_type:complete
MVQQRLTELELLAMVQSMEMADFGPEIDIEVVEEDNWEEVESDDGHRDLYDDWDAYDGDPDEAQEWFDFDPDC